MSIEGRRSHTFIVRVWSESPDPGAGEEWRGTVVHVPTGVRVSFREFPALAAILEMMTRQAPVS